MYCGTKITPHSNCKTLSTKTRIATNHRCRDHCRIYIAKHCPLKQGLRHLMRINLFTIQVYCKTLSTKTRIATICDYACFVSLFYCKTLSIKQGLRLTKFQFNSLIYLIAKHCPLKQGLRPYHFCIFFSSSHIAKHCPLKQGLRHIAHGIVISCPFCDCKSLSTKTRIATTLHGYDMYGTRLLQITVH